MAGVRARDLAPAGINGEVGHRDELAGRDLVDDDVVGEREEVARLRMLAGERAEDELRHRHVGRRLDAVPRHVAEHDREPSVVELNEVVDVAADIDACGRLVHLPHLEPRHIRRVARQERALHRVGELLLLLVQARVVDCECGLARDCECSIDRLVGDRVAGPEREDLQRRDRLGRRCDRNDCRRPALREKRLEHLVAALDAERQRFTEQALHRSVPERLRTPEDRRAPRPRAAHP